MARRTKKLQAGQSWITKICSADSKAYAVVLLRCGLGILFFFSGMQKFIGGYSKFVNSLVTTMSKSWLPEILVKIYAYALPFAEVVLGALLIIGLFRVLTLKVTGVLLISLAFGNVLIANYQNVANILVYLVVGALALWLNEYDNISADKYCGMS
ncbi:MAG TPA: MauE/DoxX family redox-associated membrane protein [Candidatus Nanoarchaeia archaeon]|nr:MauE/DoxX family redox-associated membrane protein [Candidatus Nanoarchaeia archaeon]